MVTDPEGQRVDEARKERRKAESQQLRRQRMAEAYAEVLRHSPQGADLQYEVIDSQFLHTQEGEQILTRIDQYTPFARYVGAALEGLVVDKKEERQQPPENVGALLGTHPWDNQKYGSLTKSMKPLTALVTVLGRVYKGIEAPQRD